MIPVAQTRSGGPDVPAHERGDCMAACLASILGLSINEVDFLLDDNWWGNAQTCLVKYGYYLVDIDLDYGFPDCYWKATVPSLNLIDNDGNPLLHAIVMKSSYVVHDPCLGKRYPLGPLLDGVQPVHGAVLVPIHYGD